MDQLAQPEIAELVDVLVMNDASSDNTIWMVKQRGYAVVTHVFNLGYGSGLQLGYKYAIRRGYRYVIQMDADGQHDVCNIRKIYEKLKEKDTDGRTPDIVLGSRFMDGSAEFSVGFAKSWHSACSGVCCTSRREDGLQIRRQDCRGSAARQCFIIQNTIILMTNIRIPT
ncbi:MAG: glycosyltransferase [Fusicatenibacter saccharivorans]